MKKFEFDYQREIEEKWQAKKLFLKLDRQWQEEIATLDSLREKQFLTILAKEVMGWEDGKYDAAIWHPHINWNDVHKVEAEVRACAYDDIYIERLWYVVYRDTLYSYHQVGIGVAGEVIRSRGWHFLNAHPKKRCIAAIIAARWKKKNKVHYPDQGAINYP